MSDPRPMPPFTTWPSFPFEGDLRLRELDETASEEPAREGEEPAECRACNASDESYIWVSERWRVRSLDRPGGLPGVFILEPRSHLDLGDLPNLLSAELGVMTVRLERAVRSLDGVARVHVNRWGDATAHLHIWFLARPKGRIQLQGTFLSVWNDILPPISEYQWRENLALVAAWLAEFGGRSIAEPPHIEWKSPARIGAVEEPAAATTAPSDDSADESGGAWGAGVVEGGSGQLSGPAVRNRQRAYGAPAQRRHGGDRVGGAAGDTEATVELSTGPRIDAANPGGSGPVGQGDDGARRTGSPRTGSAPNGSGSDGQGAVGRTHGDPAGNGGGVDGPTLGGPDRPASAGPNPGDAASGDAAPEDAVRAGADDPDRRDSSVADARPATASGTGNRAGDVAAGGTARGPSAR